MTLHKTMKSEAIIITGQANIFPVGFKFVLGSMIYEVTKKMKSDNTEMRELIDSKGNVEVVTVDTLLKDASQIDFKEIKKS